MIDEKKLIADILCGEGIDIRMKFDCTTPEAFGKYLQEYTDRLNGCIVRLVERQPKILHGVNFAQPEERWIRTEEEQPGMFVSVLMYVPGDHPLPVVHEGYLTGDNIWISVYGEPYTMDEVPFWMPMPEPPKAGGGA